MQRLPKPNWWSRTLSPPPDLVVLAQGPPPLSLWCTIAPPVGPGLDCLSWLPLKKAGSPKTSLRSHHRTTMWSPNLRSPAVAPKPARQSSDQETWRGWAPHQWWFPPKPRHSRLCRNNKCPKHTHKQINTHTAPSIKSHIWYQEHSQRISHSLRKTQVVRPYDSTDSTSW